MVCAPVRSIIPSLKLGNYPSVQAHKPCSISQNTMDCAKTCVIIASVQCAQCDFDFQASGMVLIRDTSSCHDNHLYQII